jgi:AraC-like DNA-binding protein
MATVATSIQSVMAMSSIQPEPSHPWVSTRHLQRARVFLRTQGFDADELLQRSGVSPHQLADAEGKVPLSAVEALMTAYQEERGDPFIGLRMAEDIQPSTLGSMGFLLQSCATLADLIDVVVRFNGLMSNIGHTSIHHGPGEFELRWACLAGSPAFRRQSREYIMGTNVMMGRMLLPDTVQHKVIRFEHEPLHDPVEARLYAEFFGCPVLFGQPHTSVTMPAFLLQAPLPNGDATLRALLESHTRSVFERRQAPRPSLSDEVRRLLQAQLLAGQPAREAVAQQLGMSPRSLHRRLEDDGTSYREQLDIVRLGIAKSRLVGDGISMSDLAEQLGFSSPQAFMRWFRSHCDVTPSQYRQGAGEATASANP